MNNKINKTVLTIIMMTLIGTTLTADENCDFSPEIIKQSPEVRKVVAFVTNSAKAKDLSNTVRNLKGLKEEISFTECTIVGNTKSCEVLKRDAILIKSGNSDIAIKMIWENPKDPQNLKLKIATNSTVCTYPILVSGKTVKPVASCVGTPRCSGDKGWFNW